MPDGDPHGIPEPVRRLLLEQLDSIAQLEVLLLLHRTAPDEWDAAQLAQELRIDIAWASEQLDVLQRRGLLTASPSDPSRRRFEPGTPDLAKAVEALAACYADRRVSVVALLYSQSADRIRVFADAFRIRQEDDDG
jgi:hypothetical protein